MLSSLIRFCILTLALTAAGKALAAEKSPFAAFTSLKDCEEKAQKGDPAAEYALGLYYLQAKIVDGKAVQRDLQKSLSLLNSSADKGNVDAQAKLAFIYSSPFWGKQNWELAVKWGKLAAQKGHVESMRILSNLYAEGHGGSKDDYGELVSLYQRAAEAGDAGAQAALAGCYSRGEGVVSSQERAFYWFKAAAENGHQMAKIEVADRYCSGNGAAKDYALALAWYRKASEVWAPYAKRRVALCYLTGAGVAKDYVEAVAWLKKSYEDSKSDFAPDVQTMFMLGICYEMGYGVSRDYAQALSWYRPAAAFGFAPAQRSIGSCYENGAGVGRDDVEAYAWYNLAAASDDAARDALNKLEKRLSRDEISAGQSRTKSLAADLEKQKTAAISTRAKELFKGLESGTSK